MDAYFYKNGKLKNSTYTPNGMGLKPYMTFNIQLKEPVSITRPTLVLEIPVLDPSSFEVNYVSIPNLGSRMYFINSWTCIRGTVWECECVVDVLGTWRNFILASNQFVLRAEKNYNLNLIDGLAVTNVTVNRSVVNGSSPWNTEHPDIVMEVMGQNQGASEFYIMSEETLNLIVDALFDVTYPRSITRAFSDLYPQLTTELNPMQFIGTILRFPFAIESDGWKSNPAIGYGNLNSSVRYRDCINNPTVELETDLGIPSHPQVGSFPYVKSKPFTKLEVFYPPYPIIEIDPMIAYAEGSLACVQKIDLITGLGTLFIRGSDSRGILGTATAQIGVSMKVGESYNNAWGAGNAIEAGMNVLDKILGLVGMDATAYAAKNPNYGAIGAREAQGFLDITRSVLDAGKDYTESTIPHLRFTGVNTGCALFGMKPLCQGFFRQVVAPPVHFQGYPLYQNVKLETLLGGYVLCQNPEFSYTPNQSQGAYVPMREECNMIESFLAGGVYLD